MTGTQLLNWFLVLGLALGLGLTAVATAAPQSNPANPANPADPDQAGQTKLAQLAQEAMKSGTITAKSDDSVTIGEHTYPLHPNVMFSDSVGGKMRWKDFTVNSSVRFHLTKDGKVDQLVALDSPG